MGVKSCGNRKWKIGTGRMIGHHQKKLKGKSIF